jgi:hypothetical protein
MEKTLPEVYREQDLKMEDSRPLDIEGVKKAFRPHPEDQGRWERRKAKGVMCSNECSGCCHVDCPAREQVKDDGDIKHRQSSNLDRPDGV